MNQIVLAYHSINRKFDFGITWITPKQFSNQIAWLADNGYRTRSLSYSIQNSDNLSTKDIVITFDDGYRSLARYALPILSRYGFQATVYPVAAYVGLENSWDVNFFGRKFRHLDWQELHTLASENWEIGSHSLKHDYLPSLSKAEVLHDLKTSRDILEQKLQISIQHLSLPFGRSNSLVLDSAFKAGYQTVTTLGQKYSSHVYPAFSQSLPQNSPRLQIISRRGIYLHDTLRSFRRRIEATNTSKKEYYRQRFISFFSLGTITLKLIKKRLTR